MKQLTGFLTAISFFLWIQPLGAFIQPNLEEAACGGNRAFHMCSTQFVIGPQTGLSSTTAQKTVLNAAPSVGLEKTSPASSGSSGNHFTDASQTSPLAMFARRFIDRAYVKPDQIFFSPATPVPKI